MRSLKSWAERPCASRSFAAKASGPRKRELAILWLREKEAAAESRERDAHWYAKWTWDAAFAAVVLTAIGILIALGIVRL